MVPRNMRVWGPHDQGLHELERFQGTEGSLSWLPVLPEVQHQVTLVIYSDKAAKHETAKSLADVMYKFFKLFNLCQNKSLQCIFSKHQCLDLDVLIERKDAENEFSKNI